MLVKKLGVILVYRLKLYKLIKTLSFPLIFLAFVLPFTEWNINQAKEKYEFQEPSLRTKVFDLDYRKSQIQQPIKYDKVSPGNQAVIFEGMLSNQCILLTFPSSMAQSFPVRMLYQTLNNDNALSKNVVLLSYQNTKSLQQLFNGIVSGKLSIHFGVIRVALNIEHQIRNKQKSKATQLKAFFNIYGKKGRHIDVDHLQSIKQLLERIHVEWSPCEQIHEVQELKLLKKGVYMIAQNIGSSRSKISLFLDHVLCQGYRSVLSDYSEAQEVQMEYGFQSTSLEFLSSQSIQTSAKGTQNSQKMAKFAYSFAKEYSLQQDHLHSSTTLFYPIDNHYFISLVGSVYSGVILLIVGAVHVLGYLVEKSENVKSTLTLLNLVEIILFWIEFKINRNLNLTLAYLIFKLSSKLVFSLLQIFKKTRTDPISIEYFYCCALQFLLSVYLSVFNFSLFYLSALLSLLCLNRTKKTITIVILSLLIIWIGPNIDTIKSQILSINRQKFVLLVDKFLSRFIDFIVNLSLQLKILMLPFLYGVSTFLN